MGKLIGGGGLILLSLFMLLGFFNLSRPLTAPVAILTFLIAVILPGASGFALLRSHFRGTGELARRRDRLRRQTYEAEILRLAEVKGGKVTVVELIKDTGMDAQTVDDALSSLLGQGIAEIEVTDSGVLVYAFHDIQKLGDKDSSRGVLDA